MYMNIRLDEKIYEDVVEEMRILEEQMSVEEYVIFRQYIRLIIETYLSKKDSTTTFIN